MINFKAQLISNKVEILKINKFDTPQAQNVSFLELNPNSEEDYNVIRQIGKSWEHGASYAGDLFDSFARDRFCKADKELPKTRYFAISKGDERDPDNIMGVASLEEEENNMHMLKHLQVNPIHKFGSAIREYTHIGTALVKCLLNLPNINEVKLYAGDRAAEIFYEKLNFKISPESIYMFFKR